MQLIENLKWRYATKKFETGKKVSRENLNKIIEAVRLSASSYGLQPYKILIIENNDTRETLKPVSWGQTQITDASQLIVFCNYNEFKAEMVDEYLKLIADTRNMDTASLQGYGDLMKSTLSVKSQEEFGVWASKQTYLALGTLLAACAELKIDACPMEGFDPQKYNELLKLDEQGLSASVIATIGYRSDEDGTQHYKKVRKPVDELFINL